MVATVAFAVEPSHRPSGCLTPSVSIASATTPVLEARLDHGDAYARYLDDTGVRAYAGTPGNRGVWMLRRDVDADRTEFLMFTLWDSMEAVRAFAGDEAGAAVFSPGAARFRVGRDETASHYAVERHVEGGAQAAGR